MALDENDITDLQKQRRWYLERIAAIETGTYNITHTEEGELVNDLADTKGRFEGIVANIEALLTKIGAPLDA